MADELPAGTRVGRVALAVDDLDRLADFYERVVGLTVRERMADRALLGAEAGEPLLELHASREAERSEGSKRASGETATDAPERGADETGLFHVAFRVPDRIALGAALERVEGRWLLDGASDHLVSEALYLRDPEGNGIEIYRDRPRDEWPRTEDGGVEMDSLRLDLDALRSESDGGATVPDGTDVGHVHLEVSSIPAARAVYVDALGFGVRDTWAGDAGPEALFVAAGDYHHHVGLNTWNGRTEPATGRGLAWVELLVPADGTLDAVAQRVSEAEVDYAREDGHLRVTDHDGIELRIRAA
jgi:catechol 2,3-dioxygenase